MSQPDFIENRRWRTFWSGRLGGISLRHQVKLNVRRKLWEVKTRCQIPGRTLNATYSVVPPAHAAAFMRMADVWTRRGEAGRAVFPQGYERGFERLEDPDLTTLEEAPSRESGANSISAKKAGTRASGASAVFKFPRGILDLFNENISAGMDHRDAKAAAESTMVEWAAEIKEQEVKRGRRK